MANLGECVRSWQSSFLGDWTRMAPVGKRIMPNTHLPSKSFFPFDSGHALGSEKKQTAEEWFDSVTTAYDEYGADIIKKAKKALLMARKEEAEKNSKGKFFGDVWNYTIDVAKVRGRQEAAKEIFVDLEKNAPKAVVKSQEWEKWKAKWVKKE